MNKTGLVMKTEKSCASIMTSSGEFIKVKILSKTPKIGEEYTGKLKKEYSLIKISITAACLLFIFLSGGGVYTYYTPTSAVIININPSIELQANRWVKIIKCSALNKDGETILKAISIKNKSLDEGLNLIIEQSKKDDFINEKYINDGKVISIELSEKNHESLDISKFQESVSKSKLNLEINNNGVKSYFNREIDKEKSTNEIKSKAPSTTNKKEVDLRIKSSKDKDREINNLQNNYDKGKDNGVSVKDAKEKENPNNMGLEKHKYEQNNKDENQNEGKNK